MRLVFPLCAWTRLQLQLLHRIPCRGWLQPTLCPIVAQQFPLSLTQLTYARTISAALPPPPLLASTMIITIAEISVKNLVDKDGSTTSDPYVSGLRGCDSATDTPPQWAPLTSPFNHARLPQSFPDARHLPPSTSRPQWCAAVMDYLSNRLDSGGCSRFLGTMHRH